MTTTDADFDAITVARALVPMLHEEAPMAEEARTLTPRILEAVADSGLLELVTPRRFGGRCGGCTPIDRPPERVGNTVEVSLPTVRAFREQDRAEVVELWRVCDLLRPWNDPHRDIQRKLAVADGMFLVAIEGDRVVGSVMAGYDGHRGWINYLAVDPNLRRAGVGRLLMERAEEALTRLGCAKINLQIRSGNTVATEFYGRLGYREDDVVSMGKRLIDDEDAGGQGDRSRRADGGG